MAFRRLTACLVLLVISSGAVLAQETQRIYLSGRGKDDAVPWRFMRTTGALSGLLDEPSRAVELGCARSFGHLTYKKDYSNSITECGLYEKVFSAPNAWQGKRVFLVLKAR